MSFLLVTFSLCPANPIFLQIVFPYWDNGHPLGNPRNISSRAFLFVVFSVDVSLVFQRYPFLVYEFIDF